MTPFYRTECAAAAILDEMLLTASAIPRVCDACPERLSAYTCRHQQAVFDLASWDYIWLRRLLGMLWVVEKVMEAEQ